MKSSILLLLIISISIAGCKSTPNYPQPTPGEGQVLVTLTGVPKAGVTGPSEEISDSYSGDTMSVERGKRFQRVDYDEIEDVVVILERVDGNPIYSVAIEDLTIVIEDDGFDSSLYAVKLGIGWLNFKNESDTTVYVVLADEENAPWGINVGDNSTSGMGENYPGMPDGAGEWTVTIDEIESAEAIVIATHGLIWTGTSDEQAFFGNLDEGEYIVRVIAPRLPVVTKTITITEGKRSTINVKLTVNTLPKAK
ncbi:MAG: hypothetical protein L3J82_00265 [Planctomycetes bacterium]|nr:hypothetical protein [Planctomycetota bacterium]